MSLAPVYSLDPDFISTCFSNPVPSHEYQEQINESVPIVIDNGRERESEREREKDELNKFQAKCGACYSMNG